MSSSFLLPLIHYHQQQKAAQQQQTQAAAHPSQDSSRSNSKEKLSVPVHPTQKAMDIFRKVAPGAHTDESQAISLVTEPQSKTETDRLSKAEEEFRFVLSNSLHV